MKRTTVSFFFFLSIYFNGLSQNLPSLVLDKNINATFSIVAYDADEMEWGIAVATDNIYVGNSTIYIKPEVGAFSVIAETEPKYGINGLEQLLNGSSIKDAIEFTKNSDNESHFRQVSGIDANGNGYAFTGEALTYWNGNSGHKLGKGYVVIGNQLADSVLTKMAHTFENSKGTLAERLLESLMMGQKAGGQVSGKQSAALMVKGRDKEWFNQIDLRVDNSRTPFDDLQVLLNYHYGRIRTNQTLFAIKENNFKRAETLIQQAEYLTEGWSGMYSKIALAHIAMGNEHKAVVTIQKAIAENPKWKTVLPAFYCLKHHPSMGNLIKEETFSLKDWNNAIKVFIQLNKIQEGTLLAKKVLKQYPQSSYTYYLQAFALSENGDLKGAKNSLNKALELDRNNIEAQRLEERLND